MNTKYLLFFLLFLSLNACSRVWHLADTQTTLYTIEEQTAKEDTDIASLVAPYKKQLDGKMNGVIGVLESPLSKEQPESSLGNWIADMVYKKANDYSNQKIDFALCNYGGIRIPGIAAGAITTRDIYELMPFDNMLVVLILDKATMQQLFDHIAAYGGWPVSSQVNFKIKDSKAVNIRIHGMPLAEGRTYTVALSDFIANGGDNCSFLISRPRIELNKLFRDAMLEYIEEERAKGNKLKAAKDGRIEIIE